jgi:hypothetical protein
MNLTTIYGLLLVVIMIVAGWLALSARRWIVRTRMRRQWTKARVAEQAAAELLQAHGYSVCGAQVEASYSIVVDREPVNVLLRADYVVTRAGRYYVAEVKSGRVAPRIDTAATRRQLLEYLVAFRVHGVLLVDAEARQVREVVFPVLGHSASKSSAVSIGLLVLALVLIIAAVGVMGLAPS